MHAGVSAMNSCFTMPPSVAADESLGDTKTGSALQMFIAQVILNCKCPSELRNKMPMWTEGHRETNSNFCLELVKVIMIPQISNENRVTVKLSADRGVPVYIIQK